jgi:hypothetical protein
MKVTGEPVAVGVGVVSIGIALISAISHLARFERVRDAPSLRLCFRGVARRNVIRRESRDSFSPKREL